MKPLKTEVAWSTPWFDVVAKTMSPGEAPYYSLRLPEYTAVLALTEERRVLVVRQYRPALERYAIELPSGMVDPGESPAEAARRELLEETGYEAPVMDNLGAMTVDNGRQSNRIWAFIAEGVRPVAGAPVEPGIELSSYSIPDLLQAIAAGEFDHALHIAILTLAEVRQKIRLRA